MTREEWLVIAAAAAAFAVINIIMWTVIAVKEKREKRRREVPPDISNALLIASKELSELGEADAAENGIVPEEELFDDSENVPPPPDRSDFTVLTSILLVDTNETIE